MKRQFLPLTTILLVDDEPDLLSGLKRSFAKRLPDIEVLTAKDGNEALAKLEQDDIDLVLMDIMMGETNGLEILDQIQAVRPQLTVIMMTGYGTIELAVDAIRRGAWDFITKPLELDALARLLRKGLERSALLSENKELRSQIIPQASVPGFIGKSLPMQHFYQTIKTSADSGYTVLIRGESGTGKELCARAVHLLSDRREKPFVMVNCPAIPEHLLESELFGYKKGAFTGADRDHEGLFLQADRGTICLDEIGDIPVSIQIKLLRVLQEQEIKQLGAVKPRKIDVRIVASTNANLERKTEEGSFREDLFYRLEVLTLQMPSLSEIADDIPLLSAHFLNEVRKELGKTKKNLSAAALEVLGAHHWPGNVRELQNVIRRAFLFCSEQEIDSPHLMLHSAPNGEKGSGRQFYTGEEVMPYKRAKDSCLDSFTRQYVHILLSKTGGNISQAARMSQLTRAALQKILRRYDIDGAMFRA